MRYKGEIIIYTKREVVLMNNKLQKRLVFN